MNWNGTHMTSIDEKVWNVMLYIRGSVNASIVLQVEKTSISRFRGLPQLHSPIVQRDPQVYRFVGCWPTAELTDDRSLDRPLSFAHAPASTRR